MGNNGPDSEVVPYDSDPNPNWQEAVASWGWKLVDTGDPYYSVYRIEGLCPYCKHHMSQEKIVGEGLEFRRPWKRGRVTPTIPVSCNCNVTHPPAQQGQGCGKHGQIPFKVH